jgi:hypothetical protein
VALEGLINRGSSSTCVAWRGESIMELTWANPAASGRVLGWDVSAEEALSDHLYVVMDVTVGGAGGNRSLGSCGTEGSSRRRKSNFPRWAASHRDEDHMTAAAMAVAWAEEPPADEETEAGAIHLRRYLHAICNLCMPRFELHAVPVRYTGGLRGSPTSARRASAPGAGIPYPGVGDGWMRPAFICTTSTAKRGGLCCEPSKRRRNEPGMSSWPPLTPITGDVRTG